MSFGITSFARVLGLRKSGIREFGYPRETSESRSPDRTRIPTDEH